MVWIKGTGLLLGPPVRCVQHQCTPLSFSFHFILCLVDCHRSPSARAQAARVRNLSPTLTRGNIEGEVHFWFGFPSLRLRLRHLPTLQLSRRGTRGQGQLLLRLFPFLRPFSPRSGYFATCQTCAYLTLPSEVLHVKVSSKEALPCHFLG